MCVYMCVFCRAEWQNVPHCVQISSYSCDLSQVFENLDLYKQVKLGLIQENGMMNWTQKQPCDPVKDRLYQDVPRLFTMSTSITTRV